MATRITRTVVKTTTTTTTELLGGKGNKRSQDDDDMANKKDIKKKQPPPPAYRKRCQATTAKGEQCKLFAKDGSDYCLRWHRDEMDDEGGVVTPEPAVGHTGLTQEIDQVWL
jgi:hypothetical protein